MKEEGVYLWASLNEIQLTTAVNRIPKCARGQKKKSNPLKALIPKWAVRGKDSLYCSISGTLCSTVWFCYQPELSMCVEEMLEFRCTFRRSLNNISLATFVMGAGTKITWLMNYMYVNGSLKSSSFSVTQYIPPNYTKPKGSCHIHTLSPLIPFWTKLILFQSSTLTSLCTILILSFYLT
jgi:hypothetical protein